MYQSNQQKKLPKGWASAKLSDVSQKITDGTHHTPNYVSQGIPFISVKDVNGDTIKFDNCKYISVEEHNQLIKRCYPEPQDILITKSGTIGRTAVVKTREPFSLFVSVALIKPLKEYINSHYIKYALDDYINNIDIQQDVKGGVIKNLHIEDLKEILIQIPPLPEQHRIVSKIEELFTKLDAGVDELSKAKAKLKRYRQAVLKHACEGKLTQGWREGNRGKVESASNLLERIRRERSNNTKAKNRLSYADKSQLFDLPDSWVWASLPEIGELNRGKSRHRPRNDPKLYGGAYPFIQTGDIRNANGIIRKYTQTYSEEGLEQSRLWKMGTLCITIAANIAETAILGFDACFPDSVVGFACDPSHCNIHFVELFLRTAKEDLERYAPATAQKNINLEILSNVAVPLPPVAEQGQIVLEVERLLSVADYVEKAIEQSNGIADRTRQSVLRRAFSGKLIPQDPADEPAEKLLNRIRESARKTIQSKRKGKSNGANPNGK